MDQAEDTRASSGGDPRAMRKRLRLGKAPTSGTRQWRTAALIAAGVAAGLLVVAVAGAAVFQARSTRAHDLARAGAASYGRGDFKVAAVNLREAVQLAPSDSKAQALLGRSLEAGGDLSGARAAYEAALNADPSQPELLYRLAVLSIARGDKPAATEMLERAVGQNGDFVAARLLLAQTYAQLGKKAEARAQYDTVIRIKPLGIDLKAVIKKRDALR